MYTHPELSLRLAQRQIEEARSQAQRAALFGAASLDRRASVLVPGKSGATPKPAAIGRPRAGRRGLRAGTPRTTKG